LGCSVPVEQPRGCGRTGAGEKLDYPETRHPVAQVFRPAQKCQHVLDVSRLQKFQAAEFYEWDVAPR
jgi:hypothetical protein